MTRVLIHTHTPQRHMARLTEAFPDVQVDSVTKNSTLPGMLQTFHPDVLFTVNMSSDAPYPHAAVLGADGLRWISVAGSGTDHLSEWSPDRVTVTNSAGVSASMMAEYVLGCCLHFNLDVAGLMQDQANKHWDTARKVVPLSGKTLLIVGLGSTGQALAEKAKALGLTVIGTRATPRATPHCDEVHAPENLPQLWPRADFVAICTPRLATTLNLVNTSAFQLMKPGTVLVNVARGGVVDETALVDALWSGTLRGAAMDVFSKEPLPADDPMWDVPNLLISPHSSAVFDGWEDGSMSLFIENLARYQSGEGLNNIVDPARGY